MTLAPLDGIAPAALPWVELHRERFADHPRAVAGCDGCELFGLCAWHGTEPRPFPLRSLPQSPSESSPTEA